MPPAAACLQVQEWILRICHTIRNQAFLGTRRLEILKGFTEDKGEGFERYAALFEDAEADRIKWAQCRALLNILEELLARNEAVEELWASDLANTSHVQTGKLN